MPGWSDIASNSRIGRVLRVVGVLIVVARDVDAMIVTAPPAEPSLQGYMGLLNDKRLGKRDTTDYCAGSGAGQGCQCSLDLFFSRSKANFRQDRGVLIEPF
jgi:hypothetical protein